MKYNLMRLNFGIRKNNFKFCKMIIFFMKECITKMKK